MKANEVEIGQVFIEPYNQLFLVIDKIDEYLIIKEQGFSFKNTRNIKTSMWNNRDFIWAHSELITKKKQ